MRRVEVFKDGQAFLEVRDDRRLDDFTRWLGHQAAHTGQLFHLVLRTTCTGVGHHVDRVDLRLPVTLGNLCLSRRIHHGISHFVGTGRPGVDHLVVLLTTRDETVSILAFVLGDLLLGGVDQFLLGGRDDHVILAERDAGLAGFTEAQLHHLVTEDHRRLLATQAIDLVDDLGDRLLGHRRVDEVRLDAFEARQDVGDHEATRGRVDHTAPWIALIINAFIHGLDLGVQADVAIIDGLFDLCHVGEHHAFANFAIAIQRQVVEAEDDILGRNNDRLAVGRRQDVVGRHHQDAGFQLGLKAQRHVHGHLVTIEVSVERSTNQRVKLDGLAFDQLGLERLDAETVQRRRPVQQDRVLADNLVEDVPDFRLFFFDEFFGSLHCTGKALGV